MSKLSFTAKAYAVLTALLFASVALAQIIDAPVTPEPGPLDNPLAFVQLLFKAVAGGRWPEAGAIIVVLVVGLMRLYGKKAHEMIPDNHWADKPFYFLLETKLGGWVLNFLTTAAGGLGTAVMAGAPLDWVLVKPILSVALAAAGLWSGISSVVEWWQAKKAPGHEAAAAAGAAAAAKPPTDGLSR